MEEATAGRILLFTRTNGRDRGGVLDVPSDASVEDLIEMLARDSGCKKEQVSLQYGGKVLCGRELLADCGVCPESCIDYSVRLARGKSVAAGSLHSLVVRGDGTVHAWGNDRRGQATPPAGLSRVGGVVAGQLFSVALCDDCTVVAWGDDTYGQCSDAPRVDRVKEVAAGGFHAGILLEDGSVQCWGSSGSDGRCRPPELDAPVAQLAMGRSHSLCITESGRPYAWGFNDRGQCDIPEFAPDQRPVLVAGGRCHSVAVLSDGSIATWGCGDHVATPPDTGGCRIVSVSAGDQTTAVVTEAGMLYAWGRFAEEPPCHIDDAVDVALGRQHGLVARRGGHVDGWGCDHDSISGHNTGQHKVPPEAQPAS